jgi:predicted transcriptional regulator
MTREYTLTLDDETIQQIERLARLLHRSTGQIVEDAMQHLQPTPRPLSDEERQRRLKALDEMRKRPSTRSQDEVRREIEEIRAVRRSGGRRTPID